MNRPTLLAFAAALSATFPASLATAQEGNPMPLRRVQVTADSKPVVQKAVSAEKPYMGIAIGGTEKDGVTVGDVYAKTGADEAGLQVGDIILRVADRATPNTDALIEAIRAHEVGDQVAVVVQRKGKEKLFLVSLGKRPEQASAAPKAKEAPKRSVFRWGAEKPGQGDETVDAILVEEIEKKGQEPKHEVKRVRLFGGQSQGDATDHAPHEHDGDMTWLHVNHPEGGGHETLVEVLETVELEGLHDALHVHGMDAKTLKKLVQKAQDGKHGDISFEWVSESGAIDHDISQEVHKALQKHLGDHGQVGKAQVYVKVVTPDGHGEEVFEYHTDGGHDAAAEVAKKKAWIIQAKKEAAERQAVEQKAKKAWLVQKKAKASSKGGCENCGCTCGQAKAQVEKKALAIKKKAAKQKELAKKKKAEAQKKQRIERRRAAQAKREKAHRDAERIQQQKARIQRPGFSGGPEEVNLRAMRAELEAMRAQLAELREALDDMRRHMGDRPRR